MRASFPQSIPFSPGSVPQAAGTSDAALLSKIPNYVTKIDNWKTKKTNESVSFSGDDQIKLFATHLPKFPEY